MNYSFWFFSRRSEVKSWRNSKAACGDAVERLHSAGDDNVVLLLVDRARPPGGDR